MGSEGETVTRLLRRWHEGDVAAADALLPLVYEQLHGLARRYMRHQRADHTLQATALVHEAWLKVASTADADWQHRRHFIGVAARAMRSVLTDHARSRGRHKRTAAAERVPLDDLVEELEERAHDLVALDEALARLAEHEPHLVRLVELRFFGGLTMPEIAEALERSLRSIERDWRDARTLLRGAIE